MAPDQPPPAIVVTAPRLPDPAGDAAFSIVAVPAERIMGAATLDDALQSVAGFSLFRRTSTLGANPTTQGAGLRALAGSAAGRALVTLDGAPQNDPFGGWVIWSALPPAIIGQARIVRGAGAGPYGAGALTGVVSLSGRRVDGVEGEASAGSLGYRQGLVQAGGDVGGAAIQADLSGQGGDGWVPVREGRGAADRPLSLSAWSGEVRAAGQVGAAATSARFAAYDERRGAGQVFARSDAKGARAEFAAAVQPSPDHPGWRLQGWIAASDLYNSTASVAPGRNGATPANTQYATPALGWGANAALRWTGDVTAELGADLRAATGESRERFSFVGQDFTKRRKAGGDTLTAGVYAEATTLRSGWLLTGGVRADYWSEFDGERVEQAIATGQVSLDNRPAERDGVLPTARFAARREIAEGLAWRAAAYAGFRPATLNELHRPFRVGNNVTEANPNLAPEKLTGVETGVDVTGAGGRLSATLFANRLKDAVNNVTIGAGPATFPIGGFIPAGGVLRQRQNAGAVDAVGLEAEGEQRLAAGLSLTGSLAWTRSRVDGGAAAPQLTGKRPALTPRLAATAELRWQVAQALSLAVDARYDGARFDDDLNTLRLRPAAQADARAEWRVRPGLEAFAAVDNLTNAHVQTAETADGVHSYDAPRLLRIGLRMRR